MNQPKDITDLIKKAGLDQPQTLTTPTPYRSGYPVDSVPDVDMPQQDRDKLNKLLQELMGSMNWLSTQTIPDIATMTNILSQYMYNTKCSPGHIESAKYAIHYLKGTPNLGIKFSSKSQDNIESLSNSLLIHLKCLHLPMQTEDHKIKVYPNLLIHPFNFTFSNQDQSQVTLYGGEDL